MNERITAKLLLQEPYFKEVNLQIMKMNEIELLLKENVVIKSGKLSISFHEESDDSTCGKLERIGVVNGENLNDEMRRFEISKVVLPKKSIGSLENGNVDCIQLTCKEMG